MTVRGYATVDASLEELVATPRAIDIHLIDEETDTDITLACGNVGGVRSGNQLVFGLQAAPAARTDTTGIGWLQANSNATTAVRLFIAQGLAASDFGAVGTPARLEDSAS